MWNNSWVTSPSYNTGASWTMNVQTESNGDEVETMQDMSTMAGSFDVGDEELDQSTVDNGKGNESKKATRSNTKQNSTTNESASTKRNIPFDDYYDNEPVRHSTSHCEVGPDGSTYICQPYKVELLERELFTNTPGNARRTAIIETLRTLGVKVYVIDSQSIDSVSEVLQHVKRVIGFVTTESRTYRNNVALTASQNEGNGTNNKSNVASTTLNNHSYQRCLLYLDRQGRLFNLMLSNHSTGPVSRYMEYITTFSNVEAIVALTILCRSVPCMSNDATIKSLKPAFLSLILGLILTEEISLSWLNSSMMIRPTPSISAYMMYSPIGSDTFRRLVLFILVLAGIAEPKYQPILTSIGIIGAMILLLANLGSRAWYFLNWKPLGYTGTGSFALAYLCAVGTGCIVPFMGNRLVRTGGKAAIEYIMITSFWVAIAFTLSDYDGIQKFLILGSDSELCNQDVVNISVGVWWLVTVLVSLMLVRQIPPQHDLAVHASNSSVTSNGGGERLLVEDHASPVGYRVPSLPDYEIDPTLVHTGIPFLSIRTELVMGSIMAVLLGTVVIGLAFTNFDDSVHDSIEGVI